MLSISENVVPSVAAGFSESRQKNKTIGTNIFKILMQVWMKKSKKSHTIIYCLTVI